MAESKPKRIKLISLSRNMGKGHAVRKGLRSRRRAYLLYRRRLAYSLSYLKDFLKAGNRGFSNRLESPFPENLRNTKEIRIIAGKSFNFLSKKILGLDYPDMQAGIKGFRKKAAKHLFS